MGSNATGGQFILFHFISNAALSAGGDVCCEYEDHRAALYFRIVAVSKMQPEAPDSEWPGVMGMNARVWGSRGGEREH